MTNHWRIGNEKVKHEYDSLFQELILAMLNTEKRPWKRRRVEQGRATDLS